MGDQTGAAAAYKRVISLEADFTAAYVNLGSILYSSGDWRNALSTFRQGLQIDPLSSELYYGLSRALTKGGDAIGAAEAATLASKLEPGIRTRNGVQQ
jgi:tetratricopeptide (TPR) repeat protein